jgi:hypothetical protein
MSAIAIAARAGAEASLAFRSAEQRSFRGAKGDNTTVIDLPVLSAAYRLPALFMAGSPCRLKEGMNHENPKDAESPKEKAVGDG